MALWGSQLGDAVDSVNGATGVVVLDADDISDAATTNKFVNAGTIGLLSDVDVTGVGVDDILKYGGAGWVVSPGFTISASLGVEFYMDDTEILVADTENTYPVKTLSKTPTGGPEDVDTISCADNTVAYGSYLYDAALTGTTIDAGIWRFNTFASVSSILSGRVSSILRNIYIVKAGTTVTITGTGTTRTATADTGTPFVSGDANADQTLAGYIQTPKGLYQITGYTSTSVVSILVPTDYTNESGVAYSIHKYQFGSNSGRITELDTSYSLHVSQYVAEEITITATDKLAERVFGISNNTTTINFVHNGSEHYSHFETPLSVRHNQLSGLDGGTTGEYYHLTSAQHSTLTDLNTLAIDDAVYANTTTTGAITLNRANGVYQSLALTGNPTFSVSGFTSGYAENIVVLITGLNGKTITWPSGFDFEDATEPVWVADNLYAVSFVSTDGGTSGYIAANGGYSTV